MLPDKDTQKKEKSIFEEKLEELLNTPPDTILSLLDSLPDVFLYISREKKIEATQPPEKNE